MTLLLPNSSANPAESQLAKFDKDRHDLIAGNLPPAEAESVIQSVAKQYNDSPAQAVHKLAVDIAWAATGDMDELVEYRYFHLPEWMRPSWQIKHGKPIQVNPDETKKLPDQAPISALVITDKPSESVAPAAEVSHLSRISERPRRPRGKRGFHIIDITTEILRESVFDFSGASVTEAILAISNMTRMIAFQSNIPSSTNEDRAANIFKWRAGVQRLTKICEVLASPDETQLSESAKHEIVVGLRYGVFQLGESGRTYECTDSSAVRDFCRHQEQLAAAVFARVCKIKLPDGPPKLGDRGKSGDGRGA